MNIYPWHLPQWTQICQSIASGRLAHALLLLGTEGLGKKHFANSLAHTLLCNKPSEQGQPCNECHSCHMVIAKTHPDLMLIEPEEPGKLIGVDVIRDVVKFVNETTMQGGYRVIIIHPATAMNVNAANALLKTLEEPTAKTLIMLVSDQSSRLPATIISRCQKIAFSKPTLDVAIDWLRSQVKEGEHDLALLLKLTDGAPLRAHQWIETNKLAFRSDLYQALQSLHLGQADPLVIAVKWQDTHLVSMIDLLHSFVSDILWFQLTQDPSSLVNADYQDHIIQTSQKAHKDKLLGFIDYLQQGRATLLAGIHLNKQLLLEDILIRWTHHVSC